MKARAFLIYLITKILKRPFKLDPEVPILYLAARGASTLTGLARGWFFLMRPLVLGRGARIRNLAKLQTRGGLPRIEDHCIVDCVSHDGIQLGRNFKLGAFSHMIASGSLADLGKGIYIGDNVGIGEYAYIGGAGGVVIGDDCIVGQYFSVHPENHIFSDSSRSIREQGVTRKGIKVGSGCWIGAKVTLTDGVDIGRNCVIAAGSVVTKNFPDNSVIGGVPALLLHDKS